VDLENAVSILIAREDYGSAERKGEEEKTKRAMRVGPLQRKKEKSMMEVNERRDNETQNRERAGNGRLRKLGGMSPRVVLVAKMTGRNRILKGARKLNNF
jgi:hypothetical protein